MKRASTLLLAVVAVAACSDDPQTSSAPRDVTPSLPVDIGTAAPGAPEPAPPTPAQDLVWHDVPLGACPGPAGQTVRALVVGNSQIYYWDLPRLLSVLSESGPPECPRISAEGFTRGGQNLHRLWTGGDSEGRDLATVIAEGRYDVVVISESIDLIELPPPKAQFVTYANLIIDAARASGSLPILYATPYVDQKGHFGFVEMAEPQLALGQARGVTVAAGGLAWLRVWNELPSIFLHHTDHSHPGFKGSMISAMVLYAAITRATPVGLTSKPDVDCDGAPCPPISDVEADVFQRAAWEEARATALRE